MKQSPTNELTQRILRDLFARGWFCYRENTSGMPVRRGGEVVAVRAGGKTGKPDIMAFRPPFGQVICIEIKTGSDKMRPEQIGFQKSVEHVGGKWITVKTWEDYLRQILLIAQDNSVKIPMT